MYLEQILRYPVVITKDEDGFLATFPDIPEAITGHDDHKSTLAMALDALLTAFEFYFEDERIVPMPSAVEGCDFVEVPISIWAKILVLNAMVENELSQTELANMMGIRKQEMQRIINLKHATKIDTLAAAMKAMGRAFRLDVATLPPQK
ncbi:type II toxin-antitoxin system HicB family antitoxin [Plesiomonas shigelloides]|uniref:type II toxin-antitoxin system HicB family antitoxin n=1 Tax=Plesiomonas shigelloides TaxID=703 RepID=UPI0015B2E165